MSARFPVRPDASPQALPGVWRAHELPVAAGLAWATGHPALDAQLPGQGWPVGALTEVLQASGAHHEWQLVLPALVAWQRHSPGPGLPARPGVVLVGPPHTALMPALASHGLHTAAMLTVGTDDPAQRLWVCEQALQCPEVGAVLAWLPHAPMAALRRLQMAAARQGGLLWAFRPLAAQAQASPAVLRLAVQVAPDGEGLQVQVLKRRGPALASPLALAPVGSALQAALAGARWRNRLRQAGLPPRTNEVPHDTPPAVVGAGHTHVTHAAPAAVA
jgi:protein ImuA